MNLKSFLTNRWAVAAGFAVAAVLLLVVAPALLSSFRLGLLGKYLCYAMVAVGIGLAWGRGGMLVLGQGVFFGLGAYIMAMHLKLADAPPSTGVPDFMALISSDGVPVWWEPFRSGVVTLIAIVVVPTAVAVLLGLATFRRRVRGAYFAILSQALAAAFAILLIGNPRSTGGSTGLNNFKGFFGFSLRDPANRMTLYVIAVVALLAMVAVARQLMVSRYGEFAYAVAAVMAGVAGALFVPIVGIVSPNDVGIVPSIGLLIGVAIGGRTTLLGPVLGAIAVAWAETSLSERFPSGWTYAQGLLFMLVVAFLPGGLASLRPIVRGWRERLRPSHTADSAPVPSLSGSSR